MDVVKVRGVVSCFVVIVMFGIFACFCGDAFSDTYYYCANCLVVLVFVKLV